MRASLHAANALTVQSDFCGAIAWLDQVAQLDPDNQDARELRRTILVANAAAGAWGFGFGPPSAASAAEVAPATLVPG